MKQKSCIPKGVDRWYRHLAPFAAALLATGFLMVFAVPVAGESPSRATTTPDDVSHLFLGYLPDRPGSPETNANRSTTVSTSPDTTDQHQPLRDPVGMSEVPTPQPDFVSDAPLPHSTEIHHNWGSFDRAYSRSASDIPNPISQGPYRNQLDIYRARADELSDQPTTLPGEFIATDSIDDPAIRWWESLIGQPLGLAQETIAVDVCQLAETSLVASPYVRGLLTEPKVRYNDMVIADAEFDTTAFVESKFARTNEPVGSVLTTGNSSERYLDNLFSSSAGIRKRYRSGGNVEIVQRGGFQSNNSTYLTPNPQGTSRLEINFAQPLLRDHGRAVNTTRVLLAQINVQLAKSETRNEVEQHLVDVTRAYWDLYQARAEYLQRKRLLQAAEELHAKLLARGTIDSQQRQILRAEVAITQRRSDLIRIEARIRNGQARLRMLTADPNLMRGGNWELLPGELPLNCLVPVSPREATLTALENRPDITQSLRKIHAVSSKVGAARNQVLPRLDLLLSSYVAGLDNDRDTFGAIARQLTDGGPSYAAGFVFELPVGNRAARARLQRNQWELNRSVYEFQQTTEAAITTVEIAVRETRTAYAEMIGNQQSLVAAMREVSYLQQRWQWLPDPNESAVLLIEDLLEAQERVAEEEQSVTRAQVAYAMSWITLRKAMGVLLQVHVEEQLCNEEMQFEEWEIGDTIVTEPHSAGPRQGSLP
ncbi:TolC family protein [Rhodopirellula sallentina]|uniref:TolC family protein n=1 Tax=Rhodopirellula sallentina TaxID=1263869 RepID=UPI001F0209D6|nr:TolC family protein [Rhodopirellula sallentina]